MLAPHRASAGPPSHVRSSVCSSWSRTALHCCLLWPFWDMSCMRHPHWPWTAQVPEQALRVTEWVLDPVFRVEDVSLPMPNVTPTPAGLGPMLHVVCPPKQVPCVARIPIQPVCTMVQSWTGWCKHHGHWIQHSGGGGEGPWAWPHTTDSTCRLVWSCLPGPWDQMILTPLAYRFSHSWNAFWEGGEEGLLNWRSVLGSKMFTLSND